MHLTCAAMCDVKIVKRESVRQTQYNVANLTQPKPHIAAPTPQTGSLGQAIVQRNSLGFTVVGRETCEHPILVSEARRRSCVNREVGGCHSLSHSSPVPNNWPLHCPQPVKISRLKDCTDPPAKQYIVWYYYTSTFHAMSSENPFTCQCEKEKKKWLKGFQFGTFNGRFEVKLWQWRG